MLLSASSYDAPGTYASRARQKAGRMSDFGKPLEHRASLQVGLLRFRPVPLDAAAPLTRMRTAHDPQNALNLLAFCPNESIWRAIAAANFKS